MNTIIELSPGKFGYQSSEPDQSEPVMRTWVWPLVNARREGYIGFDLREAIGREASCRSGHVSCYMGSGTYFRAEMPELGSTKAISITDQPIPRPKARVETRYYRGQWQKLLRSQGWVAI